MPNSSVQPTIAIIGAGLSGMCMAIKLKEAGYEHITVYEKSDNVGGTWRENTYPGVACDVPSHLYSFSFAPKPDWSSVYSPGAEIQAYCETVADKYDLGGFIQYGFELEKAVFNSGKWTLSFSNKEEVIVDFFISCIGGLHIPNYPDIKGAETFEGQAFHSADWDHEYKLEGKKVAVIGTAASAVQFIPEIVDKVAELAVYQRTPNWVMSRGEGRYNETTKRLLVRVPILAKMLRLGIYLLHEMRVPLFRGNKFFAKRAEAMAKNHMAEQVQDEALRGKLTPDYPIGCKRILASDSYFPALQKEHVSLLTDGIKEITPEGIRDNKGCERTADVIIYATGFKPFDVASQMVVVGRQGQTLSDYVKDGIRALRTVAMPGFPNYFTMLGPNSGLGHNSIILVIEAQAKYIVQAIDDTGVRGATTVEAKADITEAFNDELQAQLKGTVWAGSAKVGIRTIKVVFLRFGHAVQ